MAQQLGLEGGDARVANSHLRDLRKFLKSKAKREEYTGPRIVSYPANPEELKGMLGEELYMQWHETAYASEAPLGDSCVSPMAPMIPLRTTNRALRAGDTAAPAQATTVAAPAMDPMQMLLRFMQGLQQQPSQEPVLPGLQILKNQFAGPSASTVQQSLPAPSPQAPSPQDSPPVEPPLAAIPLPPAPSMSAQEQAEAFSNALKSRELSKKEAKVQFSHVVETVQEDGMRSTEELRDKSDLPKQRCKAKASPKAKAKASPKPKAKAATKAKAAAKAAAKAEIQPAGETYHAGDFNKLRLDYIKRKRDESGISYKEAQQLWMTCDERKRLIETLSPAEQKKRRFV